MAIKVLEVELSDGLQAIAVAPGYDSYRVLVRLNRLPMGWVRLPCPKKSVITAMQFSEAIKNQLGWQLLFQAQQNHLSRNYQTSNAPMGISVIVCTRNRTEYLATCLETLLALDYQHYEIIVVDNAPSNGDTFRLVAKLPVRYVLEERPGLDRARNRGISEARYNVVAFTDDDARADRFWLQAIADTLKDPAVAAVTGFVAPAELDTPAQAIFELGYGGMGHGFRRRTLSRSTLNAGQLLRAGSVGIGVNMAFRRSVFQQAGEFDTALDVGTPSCGAGDIEFFYRLMATGNTVVYDPAMLVWHTHRRQLAELKKQIQDNGRSFGCYLIACFRKENAKLHVITYFLLVEWLLKWNLKNFLKPPARLPRSFALTELYGMLQSPFAYRATQAWAKKSERQLPQHIKEETAV